ncbi:MAG: lysophospholipid acyltransferase family protein [Pseudonocardiales bacterium]|nr:1-acyl-sn-glycerol-3-phosphate acyltransferase [Actinomycetota bacterium]
MSEPTLTARTAGSAALRRRQALARAIALTLGQVHVAGLGAIPATGPVLFAVNHRSLLDGPLLFGAVRRPVSCLVKAEAFTPWLGPLLRSAGQIPVRRDGGDAPAVRLCLRILHRGGIVGIFPEGTRGHGLAESARPGVGYLGLRSGATVIPVACSGTSEMAHRRSWRRPPSVLLFGEPIAMDRWPDGQVLTVGVAAAATEGIRVALAALVAIADELQASRGRATTTLTERARD